jgi:hypothetical protein
MSIFAGTPSDDLAAVLDTGRTDVMTAFVSMSAREPDGRDEEYIEWHALDHQPEQYRLAGLRGSLRLVSTPSCRSSRAASNEQYDSVDHVMTYLFARGTGLGPFRALGAALAAGRRMPLRLPSVEMGQYELAGTAAAPRVGVGVDVIPWRPARGVYLMVERGAAPAADLTDVPGVAGVWWYTGNDGTQITYCYLDDDPVETAGRLRGPAEKRWTGGVTPLLAAPFHTVVPHDWGRFLP